MSDEYACECFPEVTCHSSSEIDAKLFYSLRLIYLAMVVCE